MSHYVDPYPEIKETLIAKHLGIVQGKSGNYHCFSGKHKDSNPSLRVSDDKGFYCHSCRIEGNKYEMIKQNLNCDYHSSLEWIKREFNFYKNNVDKKSDGSTQKSREKFHVRFIQNADERHRYSYLNVDPEKIIDVRDYDLKKIQENLGKNYSRETFGILGIKIYPEPYCIVFSNISLFNPYNKTVLLCVEGETDFMTAIELDLHEHFGILKRYNKKSDLIVPEHFDRIIFVQDIDDEESNIVSLLKKLERKILYSIIIPPKGAKDFSDWFFTLKATREEISNAILQQVSENNFRAVNHDNSQYSENILQESNWEELNLKYKDIEFLINSYIPKGFLTLVVGFSGTGKSLFCLNIIHRYLSGEDFFTLNKFNSPISNILWLETEDAEALNITRASKVGINLKMIITFSDRNIKFDPLQEEHTQFVKNLIQKYEIQLVILDSLSGNFGGDENSTQFAALVTNLSSLTKELNISFIIIHHERKSGQFKSDNPLDSVRGSSKISQYFRSILRITNDNDELRISQIKNNFGKKEKDFTLSIDRDGRLHFKKVESDSINVSSKTEIEKACDLIIKNVSKPIKSTLLKEIVLGENISEATYNRARSQVTFNGEKLASKKIKDANGTMFYYTFFPSQVGKNDSILDNIDNLDNLDFPDNVAAVDIFKDLEFSDFTNEENPENINLLMPNSME